ncbi:RagB/SusD family nutrient uptake outer membrane protein [Myroides sp. WP-1]|uniref:RagB/SusD family nutrient uptake outer membrane protein n=1 Tax=Myroides sp. WP-1 TaxID=2759944 RepID=UPI0015F94904|nr:RagB/SusD family nutrient uptake outer membrane protein [Myroides sp. WP-1]MBB1138475.1 RagB/SusD family nutrient uptake outer membrane protein [Myroides sp. WP-1]
MIKIRYTILGLLFALCSVFYLTSCDRMLDIDPKENVDSDQLYKSVRYFEYGVVGVYNSLHLEYSVLLGAVMADECKLSSENTGVDGYAVQLNRWTYSSDDELLHETWKDYYHTLYKINDLLENQHRVPQETTVDKEKMYALQGELHGLRALIHFELHRVFGDSDSQKTQASTVPYVVDTDLYKKPGKTPREDFYFLLWDDIHVAEKQLNNTDGPTRFSLAATQALAARVALYQQDYNRAITYASKVIDRYPLATKEQYTALWQQNQTAESIFKLARNNDDELRPNTLWYNFNTGKNLFYASNKLIQSYEVNDIRSILFFGEEQNNQIAKYAGENNENRISDLPVFRTAELYLIRAEALFNSGSQDQALADIHALEEARTGIATTTLLREEQLLVERFKELAFEGHRYFDLKRLGKTLERNSEDLAALSDNPFLLFGSPLYQLPIPLKEVQSNPNLGN